MGPDLRTGQSSEPAIEIGHASIRSAMSYQVPSSSRRGAGAQLLEIGSTGDLLTPRRGRPSSRGQGPADFCINRVLGVRRWFELEQDLRNQGKFFEEVMRSCRVRKGEDEGSYD